MMPPSRYASWYICDPAYVAAGTRFVMFLLAMDLLMSLDSLRDTHSRFHVTWFNDDLFMRVAIDGCHVSVYCIKEQRFCSSRAGRLVVSYVHY